MQAQQDLKKIIADNLNFLLDLYGISRRDLCDAVDIKYTTLCDWLNGRTYPRLEALESVADYLAVDLQDFFIEMRRNEELVSRLEAYVRRMSMERTYEDSYPAGFFELFGCLAESDLEAPEDLVAEETDWN